VGDQEESRGGGRFFVDFVLEAPQGDYSPPSLAPNGTLLHLTDRTG
jgi:hypothetical protein